MPDVELSSSGKKLRDEIIEACERIFPIVAGLKRTQMLKSLVIGDTYVCHHDKKKYQIIGINGENVNVRCCERGGVYEGWTDYRPFLNNWRIENE